MNQNTDQSVNRLIIAVIHEQDVETATNAISSLGLRANRLPSTGGLLGQRNATLLIALKIDQEPDLLQAIRQSCRTRIEYVTLPVEGSPLPIPSPAPITVGGATIFTFDLEYYEEF